ncbi:MAG TPA: tRNA (guanosine(46)-N7)-methyltransferase TrmB [Isosphaeraceae bacterium]|nr:tRNA (guanosine(46)-N7)-methyltransferase TrmB [Isosphaeraceae bacterium]
MADNTPNFLELADLEPPLSWPELFGNDHPVELEVGPGKGLFLASAGLRTPGHNFFGVELSRKYARLAAERVTKRRLANVRVAHGDARLCLNRYVQPASLHAVHVYFSDPWWKQRHRKRRVFTESFVADVIRALEPGGEFSIATDVEDYFRVICKLIQEHPALLVQPAAETKPPEHDLDYLTNFERKYRIEGRPIFRAHFKLAEPGAGHAQPITP